MAGSSTTGRRLGRYHLGEPLGGGPCGEVYRAKVYGVAGFERQFAVKRFHPELVATPVVPQKLSSAARAYGSLEHPRIARLHEYGVAGGEVFTATEMVAGLDVMRLIAATHGSGSPLPPGAALALATQAARAIGYAHGRGLAHLGICPTNVIVTPDGDVKITDFGMLAQTLTVRASDDPRLVHRIHHLAPEQLVGEAASAASDVFALGALIHELVTGERAFVGVTPLDVEHAILSGHVREAGLPKAMGRVMARCFARSPYERFPDARALADAIDAALRVTPVTGGRRELGVLVKEAVARLDAMNEGQLSGAMMIAMPMPPGPKTPVARPRGGTRGSDQVTALRDPIGSTPPPIRDRPTATPALPSMVRPASGAPSRPSMGTLPAWGASHTAPPPPSTAPRPSSPTRPPPITPPALIPRIRATQPPPLIVHPHPDEDTQERTIAREPTVASLAPSGPVPLPPTRVPNASPLPFATPTPESLPTLVEDPLPGRAGVLRLDSAWPTGEAASIPDGSEPLDGGMRPSEPFIEMRIDDDSEGVPVLPVLAASRTSSPSIPPPTPPADVIPAPAPAPLPASLATAPPKRSGLGWMFVFLLVCSALGVGAVLAWDRYMRGDGEQTAAGDPEADPTAKVTDPPRQPAQPPAKGDRVVKPPTTDVRVADVDAGAVAVAAIDAGAEVAAPPDAGVGAGAGTAQVVAPKDLSPPPTGDLKLESEPRGTVYIDGKKVGRTPYEHDAYPGTHHVAIVASGRALFVDEQMVLAGAREIELAKVTRTDGDAGLKVKCRKKQRYYVYVDGAPTGELCPTDEIELQPGDHLVELYDLETRTRKPYPVTLKASRNSYKLVVED